MALFKFKLKASEHTQDEKRYVKGDIVSSPYDLIALFPEKFEKAEKSAPLSKGADETQIHSTAKAPIGDSDTPSEQNMETDAENEEDTSDDDSDEETSENGADTSSEFGDDVTDEFPSATEAGYTVYKSGKQFVVVDDDKKDKKLNKAELTSKTAVNAFIKELLD